MNTKQAMHAAMILGLTMAGTAMPGIAHAGDGDRPTVGETPIAGGWSEGSPGDPTARAAAQFAARQVSPGGRLASVQAVHQQVVAGMNYRIELTLSDRSRWAVTVYRHFSGTMELTQATKLAPPVQPKLTLSGKGLLLASPPAPARLIAFGTSREEVMHALGFRPEPSKSTNSECGAGPIAFATWPDGLNLLFQGGRFQGWSVDARADSLKTAKGAHIGSTRRQLQAMGPLKLTQSSLGTEFTQAGISGVLGNRAPNGRVKALWAGLSCVFR